MEAPSPESKKNVGQAGSGVGKTRGLVLGLLILRGPLDKQMEMSGHNQLVWDSEGKSRVETDIWGMTLGMSEVGQGEVGGWSPTALGA